MSRRRMACGVRDQVDELSDRNCPASAKSCRRCCLGRKAVGEREASFAGKREEIDD